MSVAWVAVPLVLAAGLVALAVAARTLADEAARLRDELAALRPVGQEVRAAHDAVAGVGEDAARLRRRARWRPARQ